MSYLYMVIMVSHTYQHYRNPLHCTLKSTKSGWINPKTVRVMLTPYPLTAIMEHPLKHVAYKSIPLFPSNKCFETCGGLGAITIKTILSKCGVNTRPREQDSITMLGASSPHSILNAIQGNTSDQILCVQQKHDQDEIH